MEVATVPPNLNRPVYVNITRHPLLERKEMQPHCQIIIVLYAQHDIRLPSRQKQKGFAVSPPGHYRPSYTNTARDCLSGIDHYRLDITKDITGLMVDYTPA